MVSFWRELRLPGLIDVHTHFMPQQVLRKVWGYFDSVRPLTGRAWPITYRMGEEQRVQRLRAYGLRAFSSLNYPHKPDMAAWLNEWSAEFADRTPECLRSATFYPEAEAVRYTAKAIEAGAQIFKAHVQVGAYHPEDPLLDGVWGLLAESGVPTVIHCGSGPHPGEHTGPDPIARVLARHPRLQLIVAHMGLPEYTEFLDLAERYPGVYLDTTMAFTDFTEYDAPFPRAELPRLRDLGNRVLLGSDFPNIPYRYIEALQALARLDLGEDWLRAVCHDNAARVLGIAGPP